MPLARRQVGRLDAVAPDVGYYGQVVLVRGGVLGVWRIALGVTLKDGARCLPRIGVGEAGGCCKGGLRNVILSFQPHASY